MADLTAAVNRLTDALHEAQHSDLALLWGEVERLREALADLRQGIEEHATDTVWYSPIETACDRITAILEKGTEQRGKDGG